jgi:hypothetical protein
MLLLQMLVQVGLSSEHLCTLEGEKGGGAAGLTRDCTLEP